MPSDSYSFLDVAVLDQVRSRFAAGDALAVVSVDLEQVIWANGPGAAIFGYPDIEAIIGASARLPSIARRQIMATSGFPDIGCDRALLIRLATGLTSTAIGFLASAIVMPDGEKAILLCAAAPAGANDTAQRAIGGFTEDGHFVAFVDGVGAIEAASDGFAALDISRATLAALVADVAHERDRIVKRIVPGGANAYPAGMARLTDEPALHLLVVIDEGLLGKTEDRREPGMAAVPEVQGPAEAVSPVAAAGDADRPERSETHQHDHWYFNSEADAKPAPTGQAAPEKAPPTAAGDPTPTRDIDPAAPPVRFVWRTDADGQFSMISPEFGETVGGPAADVMGRRFKDVAATFDLDPSGEITDLLERRDTWSGRSVLWPVAGTQLRIPVDLAALPVYDRNRTFEGFRGFGVARPADAVADPEQIGLALVPNAPAPADTPDQHMPDDPTPERHDPFRGEVPALTIVPKPERRFADKVIRLAEHRAPANDKGLSTIERSAFREIGERLKKASAPEAAVSAEDSMAAADLRDARDEGEVPGRDSEGEATASAAPAEQQAVAVPSSDSIPPRAPEATVAEVETPPLKAGGFLPSAFATPDRSDAAPDTSILDRLPVPLLIHCADTLHYANDAFLELTGYRSLGELEQTGGLGALFADPYGDDDPSGDEPDDAHRALHLKTREGSQLPIEALLRAVPWRGGKALMLVIRRTGDEDEPASEGVREGLAQPDLMDLPAAMDLPETADLPETVDLKARIAEMRTIIDTATDGVVLIDYDGTIRSISRPAEALFGFDSDEVAGKPFASLFAIESQRAARDYLAGLSEHGVASILNDGREVIGREAQGRFIPLFMTIGRLPNESGFCAVVRDITQWKRAEEDLTQARAVAERASSQKTDFLARISHEIRTPLNAIIGFSELMVDEKFGPVANDRYRDYLRDINRSGNHVLDLVNDLLDISKIEAGQQEMDYEAVSLNDALAETVAMMQPQANRERVIIRSSFASRLPEVVADLRSVRQIALNIVSNAVRYTQAGGQVIVSTAYEPSGDVVMRVRDTGIGMSQSEIEQALKPFKQINALKRGRNDGTGLGLPLTKAMVEANRARFVINSTPGEGTLVEVAFPSTRVLAE